MARPLGAQNRDKPFRDALRMEIAEAGGDKKRLRVVARSLLDKAETGDVPAIKEVADRLDGKVAQAVEHSGSVGTYDLTKVSDGDLERLEAILGPLALADGDQEGTGETAG